jgi:hypothetical protein
MPSEHSKKMHRTTGRAAKESKEAMDVDICVRIARARMRFEAATLTFVLMICA